jgi:hypothetical protein
MYFNDIEPSFSAQKKSCGNNDNFYAAARARAIGRAFEIGSEALTFMPLALTW